MKGLKIAGAIGIATFGSLVVFSGIILMNRAAEAPETANVGTAVNFSVPPPTQETPPDQPEPPRRTPQRVDRPSLAPVPNLGSSLAGISVALPEFQAAGVDQVAESLLGDLDDVALTEDAVDDPPSPRSRVVPQYPERARQREIEGEVLVSALIGVDGRVQQVQILEANPPGVFDDAVRAALQGWTFEPASYRGNPVETWVNIPFPFRLN